jgi:hypothetical protein
MKRRIHITESQLKEIFKSIKENQDTQEVEMLDEISLNGDEQLATTKDPKRAAQNTIDNAQTQGVDTNQGVTVSFSADSLKKNAGIQEHVKKITKKVIKEARLQKLVKESVKLIRKKDLK